MRETEARTGPDHRPGEPCHGQTPARQCSNLPKRQMGAENPGERRFVLVDGHGLLPIGVRHPGRSPRGREGGSEGGPCPMHRSGWCPETSPESLAGPLGGMVTPPWWAAALPATPAFTAAGKQQW